MPKRTLRISRPRRIRRLGFRARMQTQAGQAVIKKRRRKGRQRLAVSASH